MTKDAATVGEPLRRGRRLTGWDEDGIPRRRETEAEVDAFMKTYPEDAEALDGLEFLSMAEAEEMASAPSAQRSLASCRDLRSS